MAANEPDELKSWTYVAINDAGDRVTERMMAASEADVRSAVRANNGTPLEVRRAGQLSLNASLSDVLGRSREKEPKLSGAELAAFTRQLHQMLRAGIQISQAMQSLSEDQPKPEISKMLRTITDRLVNGEPLSNAFSGYPKAFNEVFIAYMAAGEESGELVGVCQQLARVLDKRAEITRKVKGVAMYPVLVGAAVFVMLSGIILFMVPKYADIYASLDAELPGPTQVVVSISRVFPLIVLIIGSAVTGFVVWNRKNKENLEIGEKLDRIRFKLPVFGGLFQRLSMYRFTSTAAGALAAGVSTHNALELAGKASASRWVMHSVPTLQDMIQTGRPLSQGLAEFPDLYPPLLRKMVQTGEQTGEVAQMLRNIAEATEDEIDLIISTMGAKLEVGLLLFMGVSVGSVLMALYLPILSLSTTAGQKYGL